MRGDAAWQARLIQRALKWHLVRQSTTASSSSKRDDKIMVVPRERHGHSDSLERRQEANERTFPFLALAKVAVELNGARF